MDVLPGSPSTQIAAQIRGQIQSGELAAGSRVPSTRQITRRWGVAMATASKVLAILKEEGLVRTRPGVGSVVAGTSSARVGASVRARDADTGLTKERIVTAATAVADEEGLGALSMRRVALELGVATMSLYRHVQDKDDLLVLMIDAAFAEWRLQRSGDGWQEVLAGAERDVAHFPPPPLARAGVLADPTVGRAQRPGVHRARACHFAWSRTATGDCIFHEFDLVQLRAGFRDKPGDGGHSRGRHGSYRGRVDGCSNARFGSFAGRSERSRVSHRPRLI